MIVITALLGLCLLTSVISALINRSLLANYSASNAAPPERLSDLDKARLAELLRVKSAVGDQIWPGWDQASIPVIQWTAGVEFLAGAPPPAAPAEGWQEVAGDTFAGQPYYRRISDNPQNFAVPVGKNWAGSMATREQFDRSLVDGFRSMLPGPLKAIFPYRALILPSEVQMMGTLHETFHAYQATVVPARLQAAERAHRLEGRYADADPAMRDAWKEEVSLLIDALQAKTDDEARGLAERFLQRRDERRRAAGLPADLLDYERQLEWEEGAAKYVELATWRAASRSASYQPLPEMASDPLFKGYQTFDRRFGQELMSMRRSATQEGETRFYYTGMAQAMLLDRLAPGWHARAFNNGVWLEDLLRRGK